MINMQQLVRYIFRNQKNSIDEYNMMAYLELRQHLINRITEIDKCKYIIPVPNKNSNISLEEAIDDSINNILIEKGNKEIYVLWSGGIDSTLVLVSLLQRNIYCTVILDEHSITEYPYLFNKIKNGDYECNYIVCKGLCETIDNLQKDKKILWITGEIGDQLTGSMVTMRYTYEQRNMLMKDVIESDLFSKPYLYSDIDHIYIPIKYDNYNATELAIKYCEKDIYDFLGTDRENTTLSEFLWAMNFIYKYMLVLLRLYPCGLWYEGESKNCIHFFNTIKFQQWAVNRYKENCAYVKDSDYKMAFKDHIYKFTNDKEYHDNKLKEPSLKFSFYYRPNGDIK